MTNKTPCECTAPGLCPRHNCRKPAHWLGLCQTRPDYFALWESGRGPGQNFSMARPTAGDFPCPHRGEVVAIEPCPQCGGKGEPAEVYGCARHHLCTIGSYGIRDEGQLVAVCLTCPERSAQSSVVSDQSECH